MITLDEAMAFEMLTDSLYQKENPDLVDRAIADGKYGETNQKVYEYSHAIEKWSAKSIYSFSNVPVLDEEEVMERLSDQEVAFLRAKMECRLSELQGKRPGFDNKMISDAFFGLDYFKRQNGVFSIDVDKIKSDYHDYEQSKEKEAEVER